MEEAVNERAILSARRIMSIDTITTAIYLLLNNANYNYGPARTARARRAETIRVIYRKSRRTVIPLSSLGVIIPLIVSFR